MKELLLILLCFPMIVLGQDTRLDTLIFSDGHKESVVIVEVGEREVKYKYTDENNINIISAIKLAKIIYASGRVQELSGNSRLISEKRKKERRELRRNNIIERNSRRVQTPIYLGFFGVNSFNNIQQGLYLQDIEVNTYNSVQTIGLNIQYDISSLLSLDFKIMKHIKGIAYTWNDVTYTDVVGNVFGTYDIAESNIHEYLSIPMVARFNIGTKLNFYGAAGFYSAYLLKSTQEIDFPKVSVGGIPLGGKEKHELPLDNSNRFDFGGVLGLGLSYDVWVLRLSLEYAWHVGILDFSKDARYSTYNRSHTFMYGLSYNFSYIKK